MKSEIKIPSMGESVTEATISSFLKSSGEMVKENDEIVELETEKVNQTLYAPASGVLTWNVKEGETVKIGQGIGFVDTEASVKEKKAPEKKAPTQKEKPLEPSPKEEKKEKAESSDGLRLKEKEFLAEIKKPSASKKAEVPIAPSDKGKKETRKPMSKIRKTIASRLVDSLHQAAMLTTFNEVDMSAIIELRTKHKDSFTHKHGVKLGFMSFFVKAVVHALHSCPELNSYIDHEEIVHRDYYDIGIAVGTERGLFVPVVRSCENLSFAEIEKAIDHYAKKAREGKIAIDDLEGGGFTITNGGVYGSLLSTPILNPPQSGILGMHKIEKRAVVVDDQIVIRPMMYLALSYDHRIVDGKEAVTFLVKVKEVLEDPSLLLFNGE